MLPAHLFQTLRRYKWGNWSLVSLYISLASGVVVGLQYNPSEPFYSITALDLLVPYGVFFRSLHFYSSQAFFLLTLIHFCSTYEETESYCRRDWAMLVATMPVILFLLFTGYVLRADNTGASAGMIAESILLTIPLAGDLLNELLFAVSEQGMVRVYLHHVISLDLLLLILAWKHLRRYRVELGSHVPFICLTLLGCMLISAPLEPEKLGVTYISGPWFFLGLQELLRYFPPLFAGVIVPGLFLAAVFLLYKSGNHSRLGLRFCIGWLVIYAILTVIAWLR